jgi:hypothetical protein
VKKQTIAGALLLLFVGETSALAQGLLPGSAGGWTASGVVSVVAPAQLRAIAAGQADVLREYGVTSAERRQYAQGQQTASITLYRMVDPSAAYGAFTFLRDAQMQPLDLGDSVSYAAGTGDRALLVVGNLLLAASASEERPANVVLSGIAAALLPRADGRPYPSIAGYLPPSSVAAGTERFPLRGGATVALPARLSIVPNSERYVLGPRALRAALGDAHPATNDDWIGFGKSVEAIVARYAGGGPSSAQVTLLVAIYPTQQIATMQFANLANWMPLNLEPDQAAGRMVVYGTRSSALVSLVFGADSRDAAHQLIDQIQYHTSVTWNEPSHSLTDPSFPTMIIGVFQGTGLILLMALAVGLGFGGFRLVVKMLFPGRVFDRDSQIEILQLGLSSKPIDSRDFY